MLSFYEAVFCWPSHNMINCVVPNIQCLYLHVLMMPWRWSNIYSTTTNSYAVLHELTYKTNEDPVKKHIYLYNSIWGEEDEQIGHFLWENRWNCQNKWFVWSVYASSSVLTSDRIASVAGCRQGTLLHPVSSLKWFFPVFLFSSKFTSHSRITRKRQVRAIRCIQENIAPPGYKRDFLHLHHQRQF